MSELHIGPREVATACEVACMECPWRTANQGKKHPDGWYTKKNLQRLWAKMRRGDAMTCHPTDPRTPLHGKVRAKVQTRECSGIIVLVGREYKLYERLAAVEGATIEEAFTKYRTTRPFGLTRMGLVNYAMRVAFPGTPVIGGKELPKQDINDPDIGYPPLGKWVA